MMDKLPEAQIGQSTPSPQSVSKAEADRVMTQGEVMA